MLHLGSHIVESYHCVKHEQIKIIDGPWSSLVEGDEQLDRPNSLTTKELCICCLIFWGFKITTRAFCLGRYSLHLLLVNWWTLDTYVLGKTKDKETYRMLNSEGGREGGRETERQRRRERETERERTNEWDSAQKIFTWTRLNLETSFPFKTIIWEKSGTC